MGSRRIDIKGNLPSTTMDEAYEFNTGDSNFIVRRILNAPVLHPSTRLVIAILAKRHEVKPIKIYMFVKDCRIPYHNRETQLGYKELRKREVLCEQR